MTNVQEYLSLDLYHFDAPAGGRLLMRSTCEVPSSGWAHGRLVPRLQAHPPADGLWEFHFVAWVPDGFVVHAPHRLGASLAVGLPA